MSLVLFLVGLVCLLLFVARDISNSVRENINLSVILDDQADATYVKRIENYLTTASYAKSVEYISKDAALKDHVMSLGENPKEFLGYNPLQASIEVKLNAGYANNDSVNMIQKKLKSFEHIDNISYQKDVVTLVNDNVRKLSYILLGIALALLIVSVALINNTIRLDVYSNRFLINTMQMVGATYWFIRKPYLLRSILNGFIAALISVVLIAGMVYYVQYEFGIAEFPMVQSLTAIYVVGVVVVLGLIISALSSYIAVGRYLRMNTHDMYFV
jgi:cell division transport system permease protein